MPRYETIHTLFIERGLLIKNVSSVPERSNGDEFIARRQAQVNSGLVEDEVHAPHLIWLNRPYQWLAFGHR